MRVFWRAAFAAGMLVVALLPLAPRFTDALREWIAGPTPPSRMERIEGELRSATVCQGPKRYQTFRLQVRTAFGAQWVELPCQPEIWQAVDAFDLHLRPRDPGPRAVVLLEPAHWLSDQSGDLRLFQVDGWTIYPKPQAQRPPPSKLALGLEVLAGVLIVAGLLLLSGLQMAPDPPGPKAHRLGMLGVVLSVAGMVLLVLRLILRIL